MFSRHVSKQLVAFADGELSAAEALRVEAHLERCPRCRAELEQIRLGIRLVASLPRPAAPDTLWARVEAALPEAGETPAAPRFIGERKRSAGHGWQPVAAFGAALLLLVGSAALWQRLHRANPQIAKGPTTPAVSWEVKRLAGAPVVGADRIQQKGRLGVGEWLETDSVSKAHIQVANIGEVTVSPNTRLRLMESGAKGHRLSLPRGRLYAHIAAPPRLFFIETPSATAIDLGCTYTLKVDDAGNSVLYVELGYVALTVNGKEAIVPGWAFCETRRGLGTGTPYFKNAAPDFQKALRRYDFEKGGLAALQTVLAKATEADTLTLWHLLYLGKATEAERGPIIDRLQRLAPMPSDVTREGILRLDEAQLKLWKGEMTRYW